MSDRKPPSFTKVRKLTADALRPIRIALHSTESGAHKPVEFMGYLFTGSRAYKPPGQIGYVWNAYYRGEPITNETRDNWPTQRFGCITGGIEDCALQLHARARDDAERATEGSAS